MLNWHLKILLNMAYEINKETKTIAVKKDCQTCTHVKVCSFHKKMSELCNSKEFYGMQKALEWNNSLKAFERYASCQFYTYKFKIPEDKTVTIECDPDIIRDVLRDKTYGGLNIEKNSTQVLSPYIVEDNKPKPIAKKISELLLESEYRFD